MGSANENRSRIARAARELMCADMSRSLTIPQIASQVGTSPTVLKESFREEYGMPIYEWFRRWRMIKAAKLLVQTATPIAEIARTVGYSNPSKFAKAFNDCLHMPPSVWRTKYRRP